MGNNRKPALVVLQLSGGNDYLNCVIPYNDPLYRDNRPHIRIPDDRMVFIDDNYALNPGMGPIKELWDQGKVAIIHGIGYPNPNRSHFRSMDIWHTAEPARVGEEGWLGRAIRELDPRGENVVTAVNFGNGLPRALAAKGAPVASVSNLESYGLLTSIQAEEERSQVLEAFARMYTPTVGSGWVMDYLSKTGLDALKGADILRTAPQKYSSTVEYAANPIAQSLRGVAQVFLAGLGTRIFYTQHGSFDTHTNEVAIQERLWRDISGAVYDLYQDLKEHQASEDVVILMFSEFGRRVKDNGTGTDHGSGGVAFLIGDRVKGGHYNEYPSLEANRLVEGDLAYNFDFRGLYTEILEKWLEVEARPIVGGNFEQVNCIYG